MSEGIRLRISVILAASGCCVFRDCAVFSVERGSMPRISTSSSSSDS